MLRMRNRFPFSNVYVRGTYKTTLNCITMYLVINFNNKQILEQNIGADLLPSS